MAFDASGPAGDLTDVPVGSWIRLLATAPDIPVGRLVLATGAAALIAPLLLLPLSKTIWNSIDLLMIPLEPGEAPPLEAELAKKSG